VFRHCLFSVGFVFTAFIFTGFTIKIFKSSNVQSNYLLMDIINNYHALLAKNAYVADSAQEAGIARLQVMYDELYQLHKQEQQPFSYLTRLFNSSKKPRGVWLWGGVGRGKSFLMDCFYESMTIVPRKTRIHFHEFMRSIHSELEQLKGTANPLDIVAKNVAKKYQLLCFDEFHVSDIADAMILYRLLDRLFAQGVMFVMTSNYIPDKLYPDGLHRDRILPAIELLNQHLDVINIDVGIDYRCRDLEQAKTYWTPNDQKAHFEINELFNQLSNHSDEVPEVLIENRVIKAQRKAGKVLWCNFKQLCDTARSQNDYLDIATQFSTIILTDVPQLKPAHASSARRLTWLIDVLYDHKVKLIMSAHTPPEAIYCEGQFANEFHRTVSRMIEMQSQEYYNTEQRATVSL
jgi:cell division protein ZapE